MVSDCIPAQMHRSRHLIAQVEAAGGLAFIQLDHEQAVMLIVRNRLDRRKRPGLDDARNGVAVSDYDRTGAIRQRADPFQQKIRVLAGVLFAGLDDGDRQVQRIRQRLCGLLRAFELGAEYRCRIGRFQSIRQSQGTRLPFGGQCRVVALVGGFLGMADQKYGMVLRRSAPGGQAE